VERSSSCRYRLDGLFELVPLRTTDYYCLFSEESNSRRVEIKVDDREESSTNMTIVIVKEHTDSDADGSKAHRANRNFAHNHAMVIHFNAIAMLATIFYGFSLSARLLEGPNM
jgi:hypothetical protein